ncbi:ABC transporter substrate-binding protein [Nostoc sp. CHAB 5824]|nr:ABC transporter substrate-binding protein [Nostoc sp. CHAB 5824]
MIYVVNTPPGTGEGSAIIVLKDSPIKTLADIKGKKVAYSRGTAQTFFVVKALEQAGLTISDIQSVNLTIADGRAAFLNKTRGDACGSKLRNYPIIISETKY